MMSKQEFPRARRWRCAAAIWMAACCVAAAGCARYDRRPLDLAAFQQALSERTVDAAETAEAASERGVYEPGDGLTLREAEALCLVLNPSLRSARLKARIPAIGAEKAGLWDDPELSADLLRILDDVDKPWILGASLSFTLPVSGRLGAEKAEANAEARVALVEIFAMEQEALRALREMWSECRRAGASAEATRRLLGRLATVCEVADRREQAGEMLPSEAGVFRLARARQEIALSRFEAEERIARLRLLAQLGLTSDAPVVLTAGGEAGVKPADPDTTGGLFQSNPLIAVRAAEYEVAEAALRLEIRKQVPDLHLGPAYGNEEGQDRLGAGFSLPLPVLNGNRRGVAEAEAAREAARAAWEEAVQRAKSQWEEASARLAAAEARREGIEKTVIPLAQKQMDQARSLADLGEFDALLLLESVESECEATLDRIEAETDVALARAELLALAPLTLPPSAVHPPAESKEPAR